MLTEVKVEKSQILIDFSGIVDLDDDRLYDLCVKNREIRFERTSKGELLVMLPVGSEGSSRELNLSGPFYVWNKKNKLGKVFSSSGGFILPSGAMRSPDVAFIRMERWKSLPVLQRKKFAPICPDFVAELRSESDSLSTLKEKMKEWMDNGCQLAWLIDPLEEKAYIYKANGETQTLESFKEKLFGEDILPDFVLELSELLEED